MTDQQTPRFVVSVHHLIEMGIKAWHQVEEVLDPQAGWVVKDLDYKVTYVNKGNHTCYDELNSGEYVTWTEDNQVFRFEAVDGSDSFDMDVNQFDDGDLPRALLEQATRW